MGGEDGANVGRFHPVFDRIDGHRFGDAGALDVDAAELAQHAGVLPIGDAFGDDMQAEVAA